MLPSLENLYELLQGALLLAIFQLLWVGPLTVVEWRRRQDPRRDLMVTAFAAVVGGPLFLVAAAILLPYVVWGALLIVQTWLALVGFNLFGSI